jgi:hypothetical protein
MMQVGKLIFLLLFMLIHVTINVLIVGILTIIHAMIVWNSIINMELSV